MLAFLVVVALPVVREAVDSRRQSQELDRPTPANLSSSPCRPTRSEFPIFLAKREAGLVFDAPDEIAPGFGAEVLPDVKGFGAEADMASTS